MSVIHCEADIRPTSASTAPEERFAASPERAPSHDGSVQQLLAEMEALKASIKSVKEKHHTELVAFKASMESGKDKHCTELEALRAAMKGDKEELEALKAANKDLEGKVCDSVFAPA